MTLLRRDKLTGRLLGTHMQSDLLEYNIWGNMLYRCNTPTSSHYERYGKVGIKVSKEWHCFENFIRDMGIRPNKTYSLDRVDNKGNYCKENCRWATKQEQAVNRENTRFYIIDGEKLTLKQISEKINLPMHTLLNRVKRGWELDKIISTPRRLYRGVS